MGKIAFRGYYHPLCDAGCGLYAKEKLWIEGSPEVSMDCCGSPACREKLAQNPTTISATVCSVIE
jgi:hypothetical protein